MNLADIALICVNLFSAAALAASGKATEARWLSAMWLVIYLGTLFFGVKG